VNQDITPTVRAWLDETISAAPPPVDLDRAVAAAVQRTPQRHTWWRRLRSGWSLATFDATRLAVAGGIVALFGGILLAALLATQPDAETDPAVGSTATPEATSTQPVQLPAEIPEGVESGMLDTTLGPARWVHVRGDATTLPSGLRPVPVNGGGYITLDGSEAQPPQPLWRSSDLIDWAPEPLPMAMEAPNGKLTLADDAAWLKTSEPAALWRSEDSLAWTEVSLDRLAAPAPVGPWRLELDDPLASDGVTVVPFSHSPDHVLMLTELGGYCCTGGEDGVYRLSSDRGENLGAVRFEDTGSGLRVIDAEDGTELAFLDGATLEFIELLASDMGIPAIHGLGVVVGDELVDVGLPRAISEQSQLEFVVDDAGFAAYGLGQDGLVHVHRSEDGREWMETDIIGDDPGEPTEIVGLYKYPWQGSVVIESEPHVTEWTLGDGATWESWHPPDQFYGERFASGGIALQMRNEDGPWPGGEVQEATLWYVPRAGEPVAIDLGELGLANPDGLAFMAVPVSSNTVVLGADQQGAGPREIWIVTFDELPA
jgi:hypothetical protein